MVERIPSEKQALFREHRIGFQNGKRDFQDEFNAPANSNWRAMVRENMRKAIRGSADEYNMVASYWQGWLMGYIREGVKDKWLKKD